MAGSSSSSTGAAGAAGSAIGKAKPPAGFGGVRTDGTSEHMFAEGVETTDERSLAPGYSQQQHQHIR